MSDHWPANAAEARGAIVGAYRRDGVVRIRHFFQPDQIAESIHGPILRCRRPMTGPVRPRRPPKGPAPGHRARRTVRAGLLAVDGVDDGGRRGRGGSLHASGP